MDQALNWSECLNYAALSDVGMRRSNNQDAYSLLLASSIEDWQRRGHVFVVADGMGAHAAGELASKMAADEVPHNYYKFREESSPDAIRKTIRQVNEDIHRKGQANSEFHGMGTTAVTLILLPQGALVAHVGDSRAYRLRNGRLEQLTFDHSLLWEMSASGQFARDTLPNLVPKNIITRSLGPHKTVLVDLEGPYPLEIGDTFLLCTDGLSGQLKDEEIGAIMMALPPNEAAQVLIDLANLRGGPDNITVEVVRITGPAITWNGSAPPEPLALAPEKTGADGPPPINKKLWAVVLVALAAAVGLTQLNGLAALAALMVAGALATWGIVQRISPTAEVHYLAPGARLGRGPYAGVDCTPNQAIVNNLELLSDQLREAASDGQWSVDWNRFNTLSQHGKAAAGRGDYAQAIREFARAQHFMITELRKQGRGKQPPEDAEEVLR